MTVIDAEDYAATSNCSIYWGKMTVFDVDDKTAPRKCIIYWDILLKKQ